MTSQLQLDPIELGDRARRVRLVITDNDGVLTDVGVYYSERGEELKRYSMRDGAGLVMLRAAGIETVILTGETGGAVIGRARKLQARTYLGVTDKAAELDRILRDHDLDEAAVAYIGDDVADAQIMERVARHGLTAAPADAMPVVYDRAHYRCRCAGGNGAFRELADLLLGARGESGR
jgi:3-deoxy-D-manno-octulosonate 8-phosphate phosphatase (KDO 8-P phosphatase)